MADVDVEAVKESTQFYKDRLKMVGEVSNDLRAYAGQTAVIDLLAILLELRDIRREAASRHEAT